MNSENNCFLWSYLNYSVTYGRRLSLNQWRRQGVSGATALNPCAPNREAIVIAFCLLAENISSLIAPEGRIMKANFAKIRYHTPGTSASGNYPILPQPSARPWRGAQAPQRHHRFIAVPI